MNITKRIAFDINKAKTGAKIITRNGCHVRILDYNLRSTDTPIVAAVTEGDFEHVFCYRVNGKHSCRDLAEFDLFIKKVEQKTKFEVGDWIVQDNAGIYKVTEICESWYEVIDSHELHYSIGFDQESMCHLWSIQDAKHGDILFHSDTASNGIFIFKEIAQDEEVKCYCDYDSEDGFCLGRNHTCCWADDKILHPATKEQCDLLFQKIKESRYEWDSDKKELKKIEEAKTRRMTHQELAWWLRDHPEEHRELKMSVDDPIVDSLYYYDNETNVTVNKDIIIRRNGGEWEEPLIAED